MATKALVRSGFSEVQKCFKSEGVAGNSKLYFLRLGCKQRSIDEWPTDQIYITDME